MFVYGKKNLLKKQELAEELGMRFDEASELFSEETLETMKMMNVVGGSENTVNNCYGENCVEGCDSSTNNDNCKDKSKANNCSTKGLICESNIDVKGKKCVDNTDEPDPSDEPDPIEKPNEPLPSVTI